MCRNSIAIDSITCISNYTTDQVSFVTRVVIIIMCMTLCVLLVQILSLIICHSYTIGIWCSSWYYTELVLIIAFVIQVQLSLSYKHNNTVTQGIFHPQKVDQDALERFTQKYSGQKMESKLPEVYSD